MYVTLEVPRNYKKEYEHAIKMLEMEVSDCVELSATDFANYVLDDWGWKEQFVGSTIVYNTAKFKK